jgi:ABC-type phosphate/phosphonate transport system substrate-binding protein
VDDLRGLIPAVNDLNSCSGHLLLAWVMGPELFSSAPRMHMTGSHHESMVAVGRGEADYAAIDCVSLELEKRHRPEVTDKIRIIQFSPSFPGVKVNDKYKIHFTREKAVYVYSHIN